MIIGDLTTDFEDAAFPELWPAFGFNPNATGPTGNTVYGLCRGPQINGTLINMAPATDWVRTERGLALDFDGSNDHLFVSASPSVNITADISLVAWFNASSLSGQFHNLCEWNSGTQAGLHWYVTGSSVSAPTNTRTLYANIVDAASPTTAHAYQGVANIVSAGQWYHAVMTRAGASVRIYLNGVRLTLSLLPGSTVIGSTASLLTSSDLYFGYRVSSGGGLAFSGWRADDRIYNRTLSESEILQDYQLGPGGWARRKSPASVYVPSGQAFIDHTSTILRLMSGGVL